MSRSVQFHTLLLALCLFVVFCQTAVADEAHLVDTLLAEMKSDNYVPKLRTAYYDRILIAVMEQGNARQKFNVLREIEKKPRATSALLGAVEDCLSNESVEVKTYALAVLVGAGKLGDEDDTSDLLAAGAVKSGVATQLKALRALRDVETLSPSAIAMLRPLASSRDVRVREELLQLLKLSGNEQVPPSKQAAVVNAVAVTDTSSSDLPPEEEPLLVQKLEARARAIMTRTLTPEMRDTLARVPEDLRARKYEQVLSTLAGIEKQQDLVNSRGREKRAQQAQASAVLDGQRKTYLEQNKSRLARVEKVLGEHATEKMYSAIKVADMAATERALVTLEHEVSRRESEKVPEPQVSEP